jgi:hypothetical protein
MVLSLILSLPVKPAAVPEMAEARLATGGMIPRPGAEVSSQGQEQ